MYAKSIFGEDALANVSLEKNLGKADAPVTGHIRWAIRYANSTYLKFVQHSQIKSRIRAKSQGMALSLGDKINQTQKSRYLFMHKTIIYLLLILCLIP